MVYDCFTFFNELDLLEIRLNVLKDVVDKFVLVEADRTFTNKPKKLYFEENKGRFTAFADRIIHVVLKDIPAFPTAWHYESYQRNAIMRGLMAAKLDDTVLIGDVDEIPDPNVLKKCTDRSCIYVFNQTYYAYYLNYRNVRQAYWFGTKMLSYKNFCHVFDGVETIKNEIMPSELNEGTTPSKIRMRTPPKSRCKTKSVKSGGWHFTSLGGAEALATKIKSFSHQEYNPGDDKISMADLEKLIREGKGPFWEMRCFGVPIDESFPPYIRENQTKYAHLIFPVTPEYLRSHRLDRFVQTLRGQFIGLAERLCPPALHNALHLVKVRLRGE